MPTKPTAMDHLRTCRTLL
jgi:hypothetical protein